MATLTVNEIMQDTLESFKGTLGPMINSWSTDFSSKTAKKGDTITAHIRSVPSSADYDAATGFANAAVEAETLIADVPVVLDTLKHVPVKVDYLTAMGSRKDLYKEAIAELGYACAKTVVDAVLATITAANFTHSKAVSIANTSLETLEEVRTALNAQKASSFGRFGIVNTSFAGALGIDSRVLSGDYYGQKNGETGYRQWNNMAGFKTIWEYPDLPATGNLSGFFGERRAFILANRMPAEAVAESPIDLPAVDRVYPVTDAETGLSMTGIAWRQQGTRDVFYTVAILFGVKAGAQGGAADSITDKAGYWIKTA